MSFSQRYYLKLCQITYELDIYVYSFQNWLFSFMIWGNSFQNFRNGGGQMEGGCYIHVFVSTYSKSIVASCKVLQNKSWFSNNHILCFYRYNLFSFHENQNIFVSTAAFPPFRVSIKMFWVFLFENNPSLNFLLLKLIMWKEEILSKAS